MTLTAIERRRSILQREKKHITSLKVWKQTQVKRTILAALKRQTMREVLDEIVDKERKEEEHEGDTRVQG